MIIHITPITHNKIQALLLPLYAVKVMEYFNLTREYMSLKFAPNEQLPNNKEFIYIQGCGPPPVVVNAAAPEYSSTLLGSKATYTCNDGFGINGSDVIECLLSGWEATPQCVTGI